MNSELKLRFLKVLLNVPSCILDKILKFPAKTDFLQTQMLLRVYSKMEKTYRLDCVQGAFGSKPDGNFERLLRVSTKILAQISEDDRYYRAWVGLAMLLVENELSAMNKEPETLKRSIKKQCLMDLDFIPNAHVAEETSDFVEMALCDYLGNLSRMEATPWLPEKQ